MIPIDNYQPPQGNPIAPNLPYTFIYFHSFHEYPIKMEALLQKEEALIN